MSHYSHMREIQTAGDIQEFIDNRKPIWDERTEELEIERKQLEEDFKIVKHEYTRMTIQEEIEYVSGLCGDIWDSENRLYELKRNVENGMRVEYSELIGYR